MLDPGRGALLAAGIHGQYLYIDVSAQVVLAKLSSLPDPLDLEVSAASLAAFAAVTQRLADVADDSWKGGAARSKLCSAQWLLNWVPRMPPSHLPSGKIHAYN